MMSSENELADMEKRGSDLTLCSSKLHIHCSYERDAEHAQMSRLLCVTANHEELQLLTLSRPKPLTHLFVLQVLVDLPFCAFPSVSV